MQLLENPFHVLGASPQDDRRRILELAEERSLSLEPAVCTQARAALTNPRNRLAAEVAWLPGAGAGWNGEVAKLVEAGAGAIRSLSGLSALARANLLAAALPRAGSAHSPEDLASGILELAELLESCDAEKVRALINEARAVSGFPEVRETTAVEEALAERRGHYRAVIKDALEALPPRVLVEAVTRVVTQATANGTRHASPLIDDLINTYEVEAQQFLDTEAQNTERMIEAVRKCVTGRYPPELRARLLSGLEKVVRNWDVVAQPIQLSAMSRGLDHELSNRVAGQVRGLAVELYNEHELLDESKRLTDLLQSSFAEVPRIAEATKGDAEALGEIAGKRDASREELARAITYSTTLFGSGGRRLSFNISPEGIVWEDMRWPLEAITRLRWGGLHDQSTMQTKFLIGFGNEQSSTSAVSYEQYVFENLTPRLWRAVGVRLLVETLSALRRGEAVDFGNVRVGDTWIELPRQQFSGGARRIRLPWHELSMSSANGVLRLKHTADRSAYAELSYLSVDNLHILNFALTKMQESGKAARMSDLL